MDGNRELFPCFLHGAIFILAVILGGFGIMGYSLYGKSYLLSSDLFLCSLTQFFENFPVIYL